MVDPALLIAFVALEPLSASALRRAPTLSAESTVLMPFAVSTVPRAPELFPAISGAVVVLAPRAVPWLLVVGAVVVTPVRGAASAVPAVAAAT